MKKVCMKLFLFSITVMLLVSLSSATQIHLKNGIVLRGEIVSSDENSVIFNEQDMGMLKLSNEKILKIVEGKEIKVEKINPVPLKLQEDYFDEYARDLRRKGPISFSFSGGLSNIDGGDLNAAIIGMKERMEDLSSDFTGADFNIDLEEFGWIKNFKGELLFNLSPYMSIAFGAEYLSKNNPGSMSFDLEYSEAYYDNGYYVDISADISVSMESEYKLTAIPLTLSLYFFIPMGNAADFFITGGAGYYLGKIELNQTSQEDEKVQVDAYDTAGGSLLHSSLEEYSSDGTETAEAKCNTIGYHGGAGFSINLSPNLSFVFEGGYRYVNFKKWEVDYTYDESWYEKWGEKWGQSDWVYEEYSGTYSDSFEGGKIWFYEDKTDLGTYDSITSSEEEPEESDYIKNVRLAEINLTGFSITAGIKITF
jgi:opacity protein-like surface antigen